MKKSPRAHTKIVATVSDKLSTSTLTAIFKAGVQVARLYIAHLDLATTVEMIAQIRSISEDIAILLDTKGPEIRTQAMDDLALQKGDHIVMSGVFKEVDNLPLVQVNHIDFVADVALDATIFIDDAAIELKVIAKNSNHLICEVQNTGKIQGNKSVNVPGAHLNLPSLSERDKEFLKLAAEQKIDFIAHSFVRSRQDVLDVKNELSSWGNDEIKIIAKIENQQGVENLEEILDDAYGILIARGDLGVEIPPEEVPLMQKLMIKTCIRRVKPVIVATQMLESMIHNPRPTRAEISDVANAIFDGADAVMLSGETAYGKYPVEAVQMMVRIAHSVESERQSVVRRVHGGFAPMARHYIAKLAIQAATDLKVKAVVIPSRTGQTVLEAATYHQEKPIYAMCYNPTLRRQLNLSYGVYPYMIAKCEGSEIVSCSISLLRNQKQVESEDLVVLVLNSFGAPDGEYNQLHLNLVKNFIDRS